MIVSKTDRSVRTKGHGLPIFSPRQWSFVFPAGVGHLFLLPVCRGEETLLKALLKNLHFLSLSMLTIALAWLMLLRLSAEACKLGLQGAYNWYCHATYPGPIWILSMTPLCDVILHDFFMIFASVGLCDFLTFCCCEPFAFVPTNLPTIQKKSKQKKKPESNHGGTPKSGASREHGVGRYGCLLCCQLYPSD